MILTLKTEGHFDSAHHLLNYKGRCSQPHGHRWRVVVFVRGDDKYLDKSNILRDFNSIKACWECFDHIDLNEYFGNDESTSAEFLVRKIYNSLRIHHTPLQYKVQLYESPESYAECGDWI